MNKSFTKIMKIWLRMWLYVISAIGGGALFIIIYDWKNLSFPQISIAGFVVVLMVHVLEEWKFPGGFYYMYNSLFSHDETLLDHYPMSQVTDMITNLSGMITGMLFFFFCPANFSVILFLTICIAELVVHFVTGMKMKKYYAGCGKKSVYNPGWGTVLLGFLPLSIYMIWGLQNSDVTGRDIVIGIVLGIIVMLVEVMSPQVFLTDKNSPYAFTWGKGYFEKFVD